MIKPHCKIDDCKNSSVKAGLCSAHYKLRKTDQWNKKLTHKYFGVANRLIAYTKRDGDCIIWCGSTFQNGYPKIGIEGKTQSAHRAAYELHFGKIPAKHELHHTCEKPLCVNPLHLQLSTRKQHLKLHHYPRGEDGRFIPHE